MGDLISREAAVKALMERADITKDTKSDVRVSEFFVSVACTILRMHAVDAEPVRHAKWREMTRENLINIFTCSECCVLINRPTKYCPNCGAKMDGDDK